MQSKVQSKVRSDVYEFKPLNVGRAIVWTSFAVILLVAPLIFTSST